MPKLVNHESKKQLILEIAYHNIQELGKQGTSVRSIASAAKMTPGQIRYYFPNQSTLLSEILNMLTESIETNIKSIFMNQKIPIEKRIVDAILLTMPLDKKRTADMIVWLAVQEENNAIDENTMSDEIYILVQTSFELLQQANKINQSIDKEKAITKLHALIDGLALHKLYQPKQLSNTLVELIITEEIQSWME
ncbi:TetR/AcrR family transcriptional regulator [Macrococcoides canis]|uniref:TetR family transcriptional regulator n=1 Tax=Macrococcoides canis TaxID=1855823 RepID=A0AAE6X3G0_9STAP|nr:TetR family transcriptional regulator C-terminal domain-containing protein [Macrococcus canis]QIH78892.1 TetR family transcriptional regulator [Macrococcus canis]UTH11037.1 TetR/AcrR family transcriptional regulator [Macrococcus canis]